MNYDQWKTASPYDGTEERDNSEVKQAFVFTYPSPYALYRGVYKYGACGATVGFTFEFPAITGMTSDGEPFEGCETKTVYGDDLIAWGNWDVLDARGALVLDIRISSIIEGVDQCTEQHVIPCQADDKNEWEADEIATAFWKAEKLVEAEAEAIWNEVYGDKS
jgi:hypothetical protein